MEKEAASLRSVAPHGVSTPPTASNSIVGICCVLQPVGISPHGSEHGHKGTWRDVYFHLYSNYSDFAAIGDHRSEFMRLAP